jgi:hypothetical protein
MGLFQSSRDTTLDEEERNLIDAYVAAGKVTKVKGRRPVTNKIEEVSDEVKTDK